MDFSFGNLRFEVSKCNQNRRFWAKCARRSIWGLISKWTKNRSAPDGGKFGEGQEDFKVGIGYISVH